MALLDIIGDQLADTMVVFGTLFVICSLSQLHLFSSHVNQTIQNVSLSIHNVKRPLHFWAIFFSHTDKRTSRFSCNLFIDKLLGYIGGNAILQRLRQSFPFPGLSVPEHLGNQPLWVVRKGRRGHLLFTNLRRLSDI